MSSLIISWGVSKDVETKEVEDRLSSMGGNWVDNLGALGDGSEWDGSGCWEIGEDCHHSEVWNCT